MRQGGQRRRGVCAAFCGVLVLLAFAASASAHEGHRGTEVDPLPGSWPQPGLERFGGPGLLAAAADPAVAGQWSNVLPSPLVSLHSVLLANSGKVLQFADGAGARVWNPATNTFTSKPTPRTDLFCAGHSVLADGRILVIGGDSRLTEPGPGPGTKDVNIFDPATESWAPAAQMVYRRWYPTATTLPDGRVMSMSGSMDCFGCIAETPEVYDPKNNTWTAWPSATLLVPMYPYNFVLPDGRLLVTGTSEVPVPTRVLDLNSRTWGMVDSRLLDGGSAVMYRPGKVMKSGSSANGGDSPELSATTTYVMDANQQAPLWRATEPMEFGRAFHTLTLLPDGTVLNTGGGRTQDGLDPSRAVLAAELWDPDTEEWTTMASMQEARLYHSTALLMPDGRVAVTGGGRAAGAEDFTSTEFYSPPYLFKGARPVLSSAPNLAQHGEQIRVDTPDPNQIARVTLLSTAAVTHAFNQNQRFVELQFTRVAGGLDVQMPANANLAPPGTYLLYLLNANGVPSTGSFVRLPVPSDDATPPTAPSVLSATPGVAKIDLSWASSSDNVGVTGYHVHRSTTPGFTPTTANRIAVVPTASYSDTGLAPGTTYYYVIVARDAVGNLSAPSNQASAAALADTAPPTAPSTLAAQGSEASAQLSWGASSDNVGVSGYRIHRSTTAGAPPTDANLVASVGGSTTSYSDNGLPAGTYHYVVTARDAAGNVSSPSNSAQAVVTGDTTAPSATVTNPSAGAELRGVVAVSADTFDVSGIAGVQFRLDGQAIGSEDTTAPYALSWDTATATGGLHVLTAHPRDGAGNVGASPGVSVTVDNTPPTTVLTAPVSGSTVSGTINLDASAADDVHLAGVRFRVDGANLGNEDTAAPYTIAWNTATAVNGIHQLTAVARDGAGNATTSAVVTVNVQNQTPAPPGLVAAYGFEEGAGATSADASATGNTASIFGASWTASGRYGNALSFDGVDDWVTVADSNSLDLTTGMTLEAWLRPSSAGGWRTALLKEAGSDLKYALYSNNSANRPMGYAGPYQAEGAAALALNTWTHVALTYDRANMRLYVNGTEVAIQPTTYTMSASAGPLRIGGNNVWGEYFTGLIDEVRVYNRALTPTEVQADLNTAVGTGAPPVDMIPPVVSVTDPPEGATVSGPNVDVTATASDNVGVVGVQFKRDGGAKIGAGEDTSPPFSVKWNTVGATNGPHEVVAIARDAAGNTTTSPIVVVNVLNDTTAPGVSITAPASGATLSGVRSVDAFASDDVGVAGVQFKLDGIDLGAEDTSFPYSVSWDTTLAVNGSHTLTAVARDAAGNQTVSPLVDVTVENAPDTTAPSVALTAPGEGATVAGATVVLSASATDDTGVAGVVFRVDGTPIGVEDTSAPFSVTWNTLGIANGPHALTAVARDSAGNSAMSAVVNVTVDNDTTAPSVALTAPLGGTVSGTLPVSADASDNKGVSGVQFRLDGIQLGAEDTVPPYSTSWNTTSAANGNHQLTAVARDAAGNTTTSVPVTVNVQNAPQTLPGLVAAYAFDEGSGSSAGASGAGSVGTISGATWNTGGRYGKALSFDGVNDWVTVADSNALDLTTGMTLEAWVRPAAAGGWRTVMLKERGADLAYALYSNSSANRPNGYAGAYSIDGTAALAQNSWTHLALTYDRVNLRLYVNGVQVGAQPTTFTMVASTGSLRIGGNNVWGEYFGGLIDEVRVYNRALTATEVQTDMNTAIGSAPPPPQDTTAPTVGVSAPVAGATVSGATVAVSANASDNVAVSGVQFKLDGANLGSEDTTAPYSVNWNTTTATNGPHQLTAVARDAAGNSASSAAVNVTVDNDVISPTVAITAPSSGATVSGSTVPVSADASDNKGVVGVQFRLDGVALGAEDPTAPYGVTWNSRLAANGPHTLTAVARDAAGLQTTSAPVAVSVNNADTTPPTVGLTAPADGATVSGAAVAVSATATDDVAVIGVQFRLDGANLGPEDTTPPYSTTWNTLGTANGLHSLTAVARDGAGNTTTSPPTSVTVDNDTTAPSVALTAPPAGSTVSGAAVLVSANASDNKGVMGVQFTLDGANLGAEDTSAPYSVTWNSTSATNGPHQLAARARDAAGNASTSPAVGVTVSNTGPAGPVAAFGFEEGSGMTVADSSGKVNHGTLSGATWSTSGRHGRALAFNGTNSWVTIADSASLDLTTAMTLEAWLNPTALSSWRTVLLKETASNLAYALYANTSSNVPRGYARLVTVDGLGQLPLGGWTHLALTFNRAGTGLRLYVNGALVDSQNTSTTMLASTGPLRIGGNGIWGEYFAGLIDEVRVYNRALTQAEIQADMGTPVAPG